MHHTTTNKVSPKPENVAAASRCTMNGSDIGYTQNGGLPSSAAPRDGQQNAGTGCRLTTESQHTPSQPSTTSWAPFAQGPPRPEKGWPACLTHRLCVCGADVTEACGAAEGTSGSEIPRCDPRMRAQRILSATNKRMKSSLNGSGARTVYIDRLALTTHDGILLQRSLATGKLHGPRKRPAFELCREAYNYSVK